MIYKVILVYTGQDNFVAVFMACEKRGPCNYQTDIQSFARVSDGAGHYQLTPEKLLSRDACPRKWVKEVKLVFSLFSKTDFGYLISKSLSLIAEGKS